MMVPNPRSRRASFGRKLAPLSLAIGSACCVLSCGQKTSPGKGTPPSQGGNAGTSAATHAGTAGGGSAGIETESGAAGSSSGGGGASAAGTPATGGSAGTAQAGGGAAGAAGSAGAPSIDQSAPGVIVVLGSSTSAGTGPTDPKNAWVPRYQAYLAQEFPNFKLTNLAVGGQTTYHIQPTGYAPPPNRPTPVEGKNITAALALNPDAIIVNMPSNDQANDFSQQEQQANYERIATLATGANVRLWVSTSQPRNFSEPERLTSLVQTRDAILARFSPRTLDFWTPFATASGTIKPEYDSGDGTHLNDGAHAILADIVKAAKIPEAVLTK
jgi:lysophospholipase L1-like esterase